MSAPATLAEALAALQGQLPRVAKEHTAKVDTKTGGSYKYAYADLTDCTEALKPIMPPLGLSFNSKPTMRKGQFVLRYKLRHVSGESDRGSYPLPDPGRVGPQDLGKAITYARRYALCAVTGLAPGGDDDDAQGQQDSKAAPRVARPAAASKGRGDRKELAGAEHERLRAQTLSGSRPAERSRPAAPDPEDPWAQDAPVDGPRAAALRESLNGGDLTDPEDKPGSIHESQHRAIERMLTFVGVDPKNRDDRHDMAATMLGLPAPLASMTDLSYTQAKELISLLNDEAARIRAQAVKQ
jgi:hypothetical protein